MKYAIRDRRSFSGMDVPTTSLLCTAALFPLLFPILDSWVEGLFPTFILL